MVRIPLRRPRGESPQFQREDVILNKGDILFIESRVGEVFYTGGLLGKGEYRLPRDYDLDVLSAIAMVRSGVVANEQKGESESGTGLSTENAIEKELFILRKLPDNSQITIEVDLARALRNAVARPNLQPGDTLILQEKR